MKNTKDKWGIMKILITTDLYTVTTNGVVTSVKNLTEELEKKGHDVRILTFSGDRHSHKEGNVYYIKSMTFPIYPDVRMPLSRAGKYVKEIVEWKPDVVHSQCEFFSYGYGARIAKKAGAALVHTYHTLYEQYVGYVFPSKRLGEKFVKWFSRNRLKKADNVIAPTRKVERALRGYGLKNDISVIPSGIRLEQHKVRITPEERVAKRQELGITDDQLVLINLGRLGTEKNIQELIKFFAEAIKTRDNLKFMIVGGGPAKEELEKLAKELGVDDKVIFTGMVKPTEVQLYYQMGDVFVSASTSETQGLTYVEAAANGLPLLCREDDCLEDVVYEGENGYEYTNSTEFMERIDAIVAEPQWRVSAGKRSEEIANMYDKSVFGDAVEKVYLELTEK